MEVNDIPKTIPIDIAADPALQKIVSILKQDLKPEKIYFYGSRAQGTNNSDSDYDFVVVVKDSPLPVFERSVSTKRHLSDLSLFADLFIYTQAEFDDWKDEFSSTPETALNTGYEVSSL